MKAEKIIRYIFAKIPILLIFFQISFLSGASNIQSEDLIISLTNGDKIQLNLSDTPKTTFKDGKLIIETSSSIFQWPLDAVAKYNYNLPDAHIETPISIPNMKISYINEIFSIETNKPNIFVRLYGIDGTLINTWDLKVESKVEISLAEYSTGIYIVEIEGATHKIIKK